MENSEIKLTEFLNFLLLSYKASQRENLLETKNVGNHLNELGSNALVGRLLLDQLQKVKSPGYDRKENAATITENSTENALTNEKVQNSTNKITETEAIKEITNILKNRLFELLDEGLFDSILTYILPQARESLGPKSKQVENLSTSQSNKFNKKDKRKKVCESKKNVKNSAEIEIHVYDEMRGHKRNFKCPQNLLISNMKYFSEIAKGQKLEEMEISVHCDIAIFEWLMRWTKTYSTSGASNEDLPKLDCKNAIPILGSAEFLQMKPLFQDCLHYCKTNLNEIIKCSQQNLTCLSDQSLTSLAEQLSNTEVQYLKDSKDKIKSRLFRKFISSLNEEEPEKSRGHFASSAYLYICLNCGKLITKVSAPYVPCQVQYITIKYNGDVIFNHSRNPKWNIDDHIKNIWTECKSWSNTYWRLWSQCHFLYCYMCQTMYAVAFADCCPYHPQQPHFYPIEQFQTSNSPIGRYPCCGSKAIRYETIITRSGCKLRSHIPKLRTNDETRVQTIIDSFPDLIKIKSVENNISENLNDYELANYRSIFRKTFLESSSSEMTQLKLLKEPMFESCFQKTQLQKSVEDQKTNYQCQQTKCKSDTKDVDCTSIGESESSQSTENFLALNREEEKESFQNENSPLIFRDEMRPAWSSKYSVRRNQDNQRDFEESAFQAMSAITCSEMELELITDDTNYFSQGGSYVKIESEWKEKLKTSSNKRKPFS